MLRVAHRSVPRSGESANGDAVVVRRAEEGVLLAVVDGLGHGPEASKAAAVAVDVLERWSSSQPLLSLMSELHRELRGTRGAATTVCLLAGTRLTGCIVGNVALRAQGSSLPVVTSPGVLGVRVTDFRIFEGPLQAGSRLVVFSDGFPAIIPLDDLRALPPEEVCEQLLTSYRNTADDASVLVCDVEAFS